jgi:Cu(I)/Ag(I) efflux system periplasmic protein CusF
MRALFAAIVTVSLAAGASAQALADGTMENMDHNAMPAAGATGTMGPMDHGNMQSHDAAAVPLADGQVKKVDKAGANLTISHGPLPNGMPAMTMVYGVKEPAWLNNLKVGQEIRFAAEEQNGAWIVVRLEPLKTR